MMGIILIILAAFEPDDVMHALEVDPLLNLRLDHVNEHALHVIECARLAVVEPKLLRT